MEFSLGSRTRKKSLLSIITKINVTLSKHKRRKKMNTVMLKAFMLNWWPAREIKQSLHVWVKRKLKHDWFSPKVAPFICFKTRKANRSLKLRAFPFPKAIITHDHSWAGVDTGGRHWWSPLGATKLHLPWNYFGSSKCKNHFCPNKSHARGNSTPLFSLSHAPAVH